MTYEIHIGIGRLFVVKWVRALKSDRKKILYGKSGLRSPKMWFKFFSNAHQMALLYKILSFSMFYTAVPSGVHWKKFNLHFRTPRSRFVRFFFVTFEYSQTFYGQRSAQCRGKIQRPFPREPDLLEMNERMRNWFGFGEILTVVGCNSSLASLTVIVKWCFK